MTAAVDAIGMITTINVIANVTDGQGQGMIFVPDSFGMEAGPEAQESCNFQGAKYKSHLAREMEGNLLFVRDLHIFY